MRSSDDGPRGLMSSVLWGQTCWLIHVLLPVATFADRQSWDVVTAPRWPAEPVVFSIWCHAGKNADAFLEYLRVLRVVVSDLGSWRSR